MGKSEEYTEKVANMSPESQASKLLEGALMQIDGIISGNRTSPLIEGSELEADTDLVQDLSYRLKNALENNAVVTSPDPDVRIALSSWLQMQNGNKLCMGPSDIVRSNSELQIQVLTQQIEAQNDKIFDLEKMLDQKQQLLDEISNKLQREVLTRSALDMQKLEYLSIINNLQCANDILKKENMALKQAQLYNSRGCSNCISGDVEVRFPNKNEVRHIQVFHDSLPRQQYLDGRLSIHKQNINDASKDGTNKGIRIRGQSVPNLENEKLYSEENRNQSIPSSNKGRSIWKIFSNIKRSSSGNLNDVPDTTTFTRGGIRATTDGRLGWSEPQLAKENEKPFSEWNIDDFCQWMKQLGLDEYNVDVKKFVKTDQKVPQIINNIESNLHIKNPLHKKKLHLALIDVQNNYKDDPYLHQAGKLDMSWVLRWLDDIGLPQHKEHFLNNKIDGRVLHRLTVDDMALLHITSLLHVTSIKRGIQVLRANNFSPTCLLRRSLAEDVSRPTPEQISLWTTHRVMEWLKSVDLAEYAPNLRGAGVHGGLMVHDAKFTADLLATLLSIPPGKTLLRRHLNTHFKELLSSHIINQKRDAASRLGYIPLTPSTKFKVSKKTQFSLKRKWNKGDLDCADLLCPINNASDEEDTKANSGCLS